MDPIYIGVVVLIAFMMFSYVFQINYRNDKYGLDKIGGVRGDIGAISYIPDSELETFTNYMKYNCSPDKSLDNLAKDFITKNECKPSCCPSTFSCSTGCVCLDENQKEFLNKRGGNRTGHSEF